MKMLLAIVFAGLLASCGGGEPPAPSVNVPLPFRLASPVSGDTETALHLYQALYGKAPSFTQLNTFKSQIAANGAGAWVNATAASLNNLSNTAFATLVLNNISITPTSLTATAVFGSSKQAYDGLLAGFVDYLNLAGTGSRGVVAAQLAKIISNLEVDTQFGVYGQAALALNKQIGANSTYSNNPNNLADAVVSVANAGNTLTGTAAIGAPIAGTVVAIDINGKVSPPAPTVGLGTFIVDVSGMSPPFILSIVGTANGKPVTLNSVATSAGQTVNITPLTDLIVSLSSGQVAGGALAALCTPVNNVAPPACTSALKTAATPANLSTAVNSVKNMIAPLNGAGVDPLTGAFVADGTGLDKVLDQILVAPAEAQGAQATVTLISTNSQLGTVTLPAIAGQPGTSSSAVPSAADLTKAAIAADVLPEVRACAAALSKKAGSVVTEADVSPFIDSSFRLGAIQTKSVFLPYLAADVASADFKVTVSGLSPVNMEPLSAAEITAFIASTASTDPKATPLTDFIKTRAALGPITFDSAGKPTSVWVQFNSGTDLNNWKMIKTTDTTGCPGGWKVAGFNRLPSHMAARISRSTGYGGLTTYRRYWAFNAQVQQVAQERADINQIEVRGAGLTTFGLFSTSGVNADQVKLRLVKPVVVNNVFQISERNPVDGSGSTTSAYYGLGEALESCQDLAAVHPAPALNSTVSSQNAPGSWTPCVDETKVSPGKLRLWTLRANGVEVKAFLSQVAAVPISKAFAIANADSIFPTLISTSPASVTALNALSGTLLDNKVTYIYTIGSAYGAKIDHCGLYVWNQAPILNSEQNANGKPTTCTFNTATLNSNASNATNLFKFDGIAVDAYALVAASVLGNQAVSSKAIPR